jgi:hypothetical protein
MSRVIPLHIMRRCLIECGDPVPKTLDYATNKRAFDAACGGFMERSLRRTRSRPTATYTSTYVQPQLKTKKSSDEQVVWKKMSQLSDRELQLLFQDEPTEADLDDIEEEEACKRIQPLSADYRQPGRPIECADGPLNHAWCNHAKTKTARRRCRKAWLDVKNS